MGSLKSGLCVIAVASLLGVVSVVGCSADGGIADITNAEPTEPNDTDGKLPPVSDSGDNAVDASKKPDASKTDAGKDAGPPPPVPGTACTTPNTIIKKQCGACGTAETACLTIEGVTTWGEYGPCVGELAGGCTPGETSACGNCGTRTCTNFCAWGACTGQPANSCSPGAVELTQASCPTADTYRQRTCGDMCSWGSLSTTCDPPPSFLNVPPAVGGINSSVITLNSTDILPRMTGTCPTATISTSALYVTPYKYFEVKNPTAKTVVASVYLTQAPGGAVLDTVMAAYAGSVAPTDDATRKACTFGVNSFGNAALTGNSNLASLDGTKAVSIPPGATVSIYVGQYYAYNAAIPGDAGGVVKLNVRTDEVQ